MFMNIYKRVFAVLMKKPLKLWGISLLGVLLAGVLSGLCGVAIPGLGLAVGLLIGTSLMMIFLKGYRGEEVETKDLFTCFKDWQTIKRVALGLGWMALWIFLWYLIPVVGPIFAIIRMYEYRLTPYILVYQPEVSITDAIKVSKQKTEGYKLQMFLGDIVYGLIIFAAIVVLGILCLIPILGVLFGLALFVLSIAVVALAPLFAGLVQAAFYEEITNVAGFCGGCGQRLVPGAEFCSACGKPTK